MTGARLTCDQCGNVIGVYEPIVVIADGEVHETSRAAVPELASVPGLRYHRECYLDRDRPEDGMWGAD